jgi:hypothetical protein
LGIVLTSGHALPMHMLLGLTSSIRQSRSGLMKSKVSGLAALGGLVYSTDSGRMCPVCRQPMAQCTCKAAALPTGDGIVRVSRETAAAKR